MRKRPTLEDVAAAAGVSRSTASIVLRGPDGASAAARKRVEAAAFELGYRPDVRARQLATSVPKVLGVQFRLDSDFHARVCQRLYLDANAAGYELLLSGVSPTRSAAESIRTLEDARPSGLVLIDPDEFPAGALDVGIPHVAIGHTGPAELERVSTSTGLGVRQAMEHLAALGHQRVCHVSGGTHPVARRRREVFELEAERLSIEGWTIESPDGTVAGGIAAARSILASSLPTAVLAYNDEVAVGVITELSRHGLLVPREVSVMGFDDVGWIASGLGLTSVSQRIDLLSQYAVRLLLERAPSVFRPEGPAHLKVEPELKIRDSTAPPGSN